MSSAALAWMIAAHVAAAASPSPTRPSSTDTRSALEGPGLVGSPELAFLGVLAIGIAALLATLIYVRLTASRTNRSD